MVAVTDKIFCPPFFYSIFFAFIYKNQPLKMNLNVRYFTYYNIF